MTPDQRPGRGSRRRDVFVALGSTMAANSLRFPQGLSYAPEQQVLPYIETDRGNKLRLERAYNGEPVDLQDPLITYISRNYGAKGPATVAFIGAEIDGQTKTIGVALDADCIYNLFEEKNILGDAKSPGGIWVPYQRVSALSGKMFLAEAPYVPKAVIRIHSIRDGERVIECRETSALEDIGQAVRRLSENQDFRNQVRNIPENAGEFIGRNSRRFWDGLRRGWTDPTR